MNILVKVGNNILDVAEDPFAVIDSRPSFMNLDSRKYGTIKGLKFPFTDKNKVAFGFSDTEFTSLTTVRSYIDTEIYLYGIRQLKGTLKIVGNDGKNYTGVFTSRNSQIETLEGYKLDDAIALHNFDNATWAGLTNQQKVDYMTGNTDPAWVLPFIGATYHPYNYLTSLNIVPYGIFNGVAQDLHYNLGVAISETLSDASVTVLVYESSTEVAFTSSNLYALMSLLFTPTWTWSINNLNAPSDSVFRETYDGIDATTSSKDIIRNTTMNKAGDKTIWEILVELSKYLGFYIDVRFNDILLIPFTEFEIGSPLDWSNKLVRKNNKKYFIQGFEKKNYIRYDVADTTKKDFGQLEFTQDVDYLKEEKTLFTLKNIVPGIYDFPPVQGFFKINWDSKYSGGIIITYLDNTATVSGWAEQFQGTISRGVGNNYATTFYQLKFYQPTAEFQILQDILDQAVEITTELYLSPQDLQDLKPYNTIQINELGGEFIVEPFEWVKGKATKLKLLKIR